MVNKDGYKAILLVSDNQLDIQRIEKQFMDTGGLECKLLRCSMLPAAIEQLKNERLAIDIVILDLRLKDGGSPADLLKLLKESSRNIPVIVLTGNDAGERALAAPLLATGAVGHVYKENFNSLVGIIGSLLFPAKFRA